MTFLLGWGQRTFPIAAALFFAYLGVNQTASDGFFLVGEEHAALTFDMVLAVPLILTAFLGRGAPRRVAQRALPNLPCLAWGGILVGGILSTAVAVDPGVATATLVSRIVLPALVMWGLYRRLGGIDDFRVVWFGLFVGVFSITLFDFRRMVLGAGYALGQEDHISQRWLGVTGSFSIPLLFVTGTALWVASAKAEANSVGKAVFWVSFAGLAGVLVWLSGGRAPTMGIALLALWWLYTALAGSLVRMRLLLLVLFGSAAVAGIIVFSVSQTTQNVNLVLERFLLNIPQGIEGESRWMIWTQAILQWKESPLLGLGPNNWVVLNPYYESVHSSVIGLLYDIGLAGLVSYGLLFFWTLAASRKATYHNLAREEQRFFLGCRAGWVVMMVTLAPYLSFTSGQFKNSIFAYVVFMFPLLVMLVYTRHGAPGAVDDVHGPAAQGGAGYAGRRAGDRAGGGRRGTCSLSG
ncbi:MAG: O-antigen ligase family protein [Phycisphaerae bacterium]|nr:O-antigen ligase family protein [Phycisphaerae bacterium]